MAEYKSRHTGEEIDKAVEEVSTKVPLVHDSGGVRVMRDVGRWYSVNVTGAMKIKLPVSWTGAMFALKIAGYTYANSQAWELIVGGHNYEFGQWLHTSAILTARTKVITRVRFAHDGDTCCILLNSADTTWSYPTIVVTDVFTGRTLTGVTHENWSIAPITTESGITNVVETPVNWVVTDDGVWYDLVLENGATAGNNRPQYRKVGNVVFLRGSVTPNSTGMIGFATLPVGFRAPWNTTKVITQSSSITSALRTRMLFTSGSGVLYLGVYPDVVTNFEITCSFIADQ